MIEIIRAFRYWIESKDIWDSLAEREPNTAPWATYLYSQKSGDPVLWDGSKWVLCDFEF